MSELVEYVRRGGNKRFRKVNGRRKQGTSGGNKVGVFVAVKDDSGEVNIGWSLCHKKSGDAFDPLFGYNVASGRAKRGKTKTPIAKSLIKKADQFKGRVARYFKTDNIKIVGAGSTVETLEGAS